MGDWRSKRKRKRNRNAKQMCFNAWSQTIDYYHVVVVVVVQIEHKSIFSVFTLALCSYIFLLHVFSCECVCSLLVQRCVIFFCVCPAPAYLHTWIHTTDTYIMYINWISFCMFVYWLVYFCILQIGGFMHLLSFLI